MKVYFKFEYVGQLIWERILQIWLMLVFKTEKGSKIVSYVTSLSFF